MLLPLAGIFLSGQAIQDGLGVISAPAMATLLPQRFSAAGMATVFATMVAWSACQRHMVNCFGWPLLLVFNSLIGIAGAIVCMIGASEGSAGIVLSGHVLFGCHRAGHVFMRYAPLELQPGPKGLRLMGNMMSFGIVSGVVGPTIASRLTELNTEKVFHVSLDRFATAFGGIIVMCVIQLAFCIAFVVMRVAPAARQGLVLEDCSEESAEVSTTERCSCFRTMVEDIPDKKRVSLMALMAGSLSWGLMLFVTMPFPTVAQEIADLTVVQAAMRVIMHDVSMWAPSRFTTELITSCGSQRILLCGIALYLCAFVLMYEAAWLPSGGMESAVVWAFMLILGVGWNLIWLAATKILSQQSQSAQSLSEVFVNLSNVLFLFISFAFTNPWEQAPHVATACLAVLILVSIWVKATAPFARSVAVASKSGESFSTVSTSATSHDATP